jgi:hypothetical protein
MSDQQQESAGGDDLSGLTGFFFYAFIVHPITAWILRPGRFERKKSIMYAIAFLAALASIKTGTDHKESSLFDAPAEATAPSSVQRRHDRVRDGRPHDASTCTDKPSVRTSVRQKSNTLAFR